MKALRFAVLCATSLLLSHNAFAGTLSCIDKAGRTAVFVPTSARATTARITGVKGVSKKAEYNCEITGTPSAAGITGECTADRQPTLGLQVNPITASTGVQNQMVISDVSGAPLFVGLCVEQ